MNLLKSLFSAVKTTPATESRTSNRARLNAEYLEGRENMSPVVLQGTNFYLASWSNWHDGGWSDPGYAEITINRVNPVGNNSYTNLIDQLEGLPNGPTYFVTGTMRDIINDQTLTMTGYAVDLGNGITEVNLDALGRTVNAGFKGIMEDNGHAATIAFGTYTSQMTGFYPASSFDVFYGD